LKSYGKNDPISITEILSEIPEMFEIFLA